MKIKILLLTLCTFIVVQLTGQKSWREQRLKLHLKQQGAALEKIPLGQANFTKANSRSTQEGEVWNKTATNAIPENQEVNSLKMVDENIAWMTCSAYLYGAPDVVNANVHRSQDGGVTWEQLSIPNTEGFFAVDIAPVDENTAYVSLWGPDFFNDGSTDAIYRTSDGGNSWEKIESYPYSPSYIHFFNDQEGWVFGLDLSSFLLVMSVTSDGGVTWSHAGGDGWVIPEGRVLPPIDENEFIGTFLYAPKSNYDIIGSSIIIGGTNYWISHDKGYSWERFSSPMFEEENLVHGTVAMKDSLTYMFASNLTIDFNFETSTVYRTTDGGQNWIKSICPVNPSAAAYLHGTEMDFVITGQEQGFDPSFGYGITGTARTNDLETWEMGNSVGLQAIDFHTENIGLGTFANYAGIQEAGIVYSWGTPQLLEYDATILSTNDYPYTIISLRHLSESVHYEYLISNTGLNNLADFELKMDVFLDGVLQTMETETVTVETNTSTVIDLFYLPTEIGNYEFRVTGRQSNLGTDFFQQSRFLEVSNTTLARDNGKVTLAYTLDPDRDDFTYGYFGTEYELLEEDNLTALSVVIDQGQSDSTAQFNFIIKAIDEEGNVVDENVYESDLLPANDFFTENFVHVTYTLPEPITLPKGKYIFAVGQSQPLGLIGFDLTEQTNFGAWWFSPVGFGGNPIPWTKFDDGSSPTLMLRAIFENLMPTSLSTDILTENTPLKIFPNPFEQELNILLDFKQESEVGVQVFDMAGKQWMQFIANHQEIIRKNMNVLPEGTYLVKLQNGQYQRLVKVVKQ